ncbi:MAG TPA: alpha/beta hydrolase [Alphaproteobacteria bacterium]|jgi:pimeloyl-ACP methyl ester carboxylesterase
MPDNQSMETLAPPEPREVLEVTTHDGATIRLRRHGNAAGPRVVLSHGNGFAIDGYWPFWRLLCEGFDVVVYDFRNHGQNPRHSIEGHRYPNFARDMDAIWEAMTAKWGKKPSAGLFHSMSALTSVVQLADIGRRWDALVLFDPPLFPPEGHPLYESALGLEQRLSRWATGRRERFKDPEELAAQFRQNRTMQRWIPGTHELMARSILRQEPETGDWVLSCPPAFESQVYLSNITLGAWTRLAKMPRTTKLICSDPTLKDAGPPAFTGRDAAQFFGIAYEAIPETSHMLQIERPGACVAAALSFLDSCGIRSA